MNRMEELREEKNISMKEAAQKLGMPYTTYVNYEKGKREPNSETLISIANFFNTSIDYLLGRSDAIRDPMQNKDAASYPGSTPLLNDHDTPTALMIGMAYDQAVPAIQAAVRKLLDVPDDSTEALKAQIHAAGITVPKDFDKIVERANAMSELLNQKSPVKK